MGGIVIHNWVLEAKSCGVLIDVNEVKLRTFKKQVVSWQLGVLCPVFDSSVIEGMEVNRTDFLSLLNSVDVVFPQHVQNGFSNFQSVQIPVHLLVFGLN